MFGRAEWFRVHADGRRLRAVSWQGQAYTAAWLAVVLAPFAALMFRSQAVEATVWMLAALGFLRWEIGQLRREIAPVAGSPVLYIDGDGRCETMARRPPVATAKRGLQA